MTYLKGILVGLVASFLAAITFPFVFGFGALLFVKSPVGSPNQAISWDLRSALGDPLFLWCFGLSVLFFFGIGFWVGFRKLTR
jgi:hypothetical protein